MQTPTAGPERQYAGYQEGPTGSADNLGHFRIAPRVAAQNMSPEPLRADECASVHGGCWRGQCKPHRHHQKTVATHDGRLSRGVSPVKFPDEIADLLEASVHAGTLPVSLPAGNSRPTGQLQVAHVRQRWLQRLVLKLTSAPRVFQAGLDLWRGTTDCDPHMTAAVPLNINDQDLLIVFCERFQSAEVKLVEQQEGPVRMAASISRMAIPDVSDGHLDILSCWRSVTMYWLLGIYSSSCSSRPLDTLAIHGRLNSGEGCLMQKVTPLITAAQFVDDFRRIGQGPGGPRREREMVGRCLADSRWDPVRLVHRRIQMVQRLPR